MPVPDLLSGGKWGDSESSDEEPVYSSIAPSVNSTQSQTTSAEAPREEGGAPRAGRGMVTLGGDMRLNTGAKDQSCSQSCWDPASKASMLKNSAENHAAAVEVSTESLTKPATAKQPKGRGFQTASFSVLRPADDDNLLFDKVESISPKESSSSVLANNPAEDVSARHPHNAINESETRRRPTDKKDADFSKWRKQKQMHQQSNEPESRGNGLHANSASIDTAEEDSGIDPANQRQNAKGKTAQNGLLRFIQNNQLSRREYEEFDREERKKRHLQFRSERNRQQQQLYRPRKKEAVIMPEGDNVEQGSLAASQNKQPHPSVQSSNVRRKEVKGRGSVKGQQERGRPPVYAPSPAKKTGFSGGKSVVEASKSIQETGQAVDRQLQKSRNSANQTVSAASSNSATGRSLVNSYQSDHSNCSDSDSDGVEGLTDGLTKFIVRVNPSGQRHVSRMDSLPSDRASVRRDQEEGSNQVKGRGRVRAHLTSGSRAAGSQSVQQPSAARRDRRKQGSNRAQGHKRVKEANLGPRLTAEEIGKLPDYDSGGSSGDGDEVSLYSHSQVSVTTDGDLGSLLGDSGAWSGSDCDISHGRPLSRGSNRGSSKQLENFQHAAQSPNSPGPSGTPNSDGSAGRSSPTSGANQALKIDDAATGEKLRRRGRGQPMRLYSARQRHANLGDGMIAAAIQEGDEHEERE